MEDTTTMLLRSQIESEKAVIKANRNYLRKAPAGRIKIRDVNDHRYYAHEFTDAKTGKRREVRIKYDDDLVPKLLQKEVSSETIARCNSNIQVVTKAIEAYQPLDHTAVCLSLRPKIKDIALATAPRILTQWETEDYIKREDKEGRNVHPTLKGDLVASKSESIIADTLFHFHIPYHYDERIDVLSPYNNYYYPDFTILLPNGRKIYWEHFGKLDEPKYFDHNLEKLIRYHNKGIDFGNNLIITVDTIKRNIDVNAVRGCIENFIMPYMQ